MILIFLESKRTLRLFEISANSFVIGDIVCDPSTRESSKWRKMPRVRKLPLETDAGVSDKFYDCPYLYSGIYLNDDDKR